MYAIAFDVVTLFALTAGAITGNFELQPHPNEFHEGEVVAWSGDAVPIELGRPFATWTWDVPLGVEDWGLLMSFVGENASVEVFISTRTNQLSVDGTAYEYRCYQALMHRPEWDSVSHYRYDGVSVKFSKLRSV